MKQKIYSLAVTSHIHEVSTEVSLFADLKSAQTAMNESFEGNLSLLCGSTKKKMEYSIEDMGAHICDEFCEDVHLEWTIEEHCLNVEFKFGD